MNFLSKFKLICEKFIEKKYDIVEFQGRIERLTIPNDLSNRYNDLIKQSSNRLEEIRFCSLRENFYKYGLEVANNILDSIENDMN